MISTKPARLVAERKAVEADETYIGGKEANKHAPGNGKGVGGGPGGKMPVVSLVERDGRTKSFHVANVTAANLRPILVKHADRKSHLMVLTTAGSIHRSAVMSSRGIPASTTPPRNTCGLAASRTPTRSKAISRC